MQIRFSAASSFSVTPAASGQAPLTAATSSPSADTVRFGRGDGIRKAWKNEAKVAARLDRELAALGLAPVGRMGVLDGKGPLLCISYNTPEAREQILEMLQRQPGWDPNPRRTRPMLFDALTAVGLVDGVEVALFDEKRADEALGDSDLAPPPEGTERTRPPFEF